jgi:hypothetical protein
MAYIDAGICVARKDSCHALIFAFVRRIDRNRDCQHGLFGWIAESKAIPETMSWSLQAAGRRPYKNGPNAKFGQVVGGMATTATLPSDGMIWKFSE